MQTFSTVRSAKEFLVSRIVFEARRENVQLSQVEERMLYFSETGWTLPEIDSISNAFQRDYDDVEFEQKIGTLIRNFCADARKNNRDELSAWKEAVRTISTEDHYLLVLIGVTDGKLAMHKPIGSGRRFLKLLAFGTGLALIIFGVSYFVLVMLNR
jgi:hypothetical protein